MGWLIKLWNAKMADDDEKQSLLPFDIKPFQKKIEIKSETDFYH